MSIRGLVFLVLCGLTNSAQALIIFDGALTRHDLDVYRQLQSIGTLWPARSYPGGVPNRIELISDPHWYGRAARISLGDTDPETALGKRSEIVGPIESLQTERWYAWAYYIPRSWHPSTTVISQFHETEDRWDFAAHPPTLAFQTQPNGTILVRNTFDTNSRTSPSSYEVRSLTSFELNAGQWTTIAMHVRWSSTETGFMEIFRNGVRIFSEYDHPNTFNDESGPYFKAGLYEQSRMGTGLQTMQFAGFVTGDAEESLSTITAAVPEPANYVLLVAGLAIVIVVRRRIG